MRSSPMKRVFVATWLLASIVRLCLAGAPANGGDRETHVLILNGTDPYLPQYLAVDSAMRASLANHRAERIVLFSESLDAQLFTEDALDTENFALLAKKYKGLHINVVDVVSRAALEFFQRHGSRLWPGARIVYQGFMGEAVDRTELPPNSIEIAPLNDVGATIDMAWRMQPNARRILVVSGASDIDKRSEQLARKRLATVATPEVEFLSGLPSPELIARIAAEPTDSIVIYLAQFRDRDGRPYMPQEDLSEISRISRAPEFWAAPWNLMRGAAAWLPNRCKQRSQASPLTRAASCSLRRVAVLRTRGHCGTGRWTRAACLPVARFASPSARIGANIRADLQPYWR